MKEFPITILFKISSNGELGSRPMFCWDKIKNMSCSLLMLALTAAPAQKDSPRKETENLSFLLGKWRVERIYNPESGNPRVLKGTLDCQYVANGAFIMCEYNMERPNKPNALDIVYFNHNNIHKRYESLWLSSTWPIKVLLQGELIKEKNLLTLKTAASFLIENNVTEYVRDEMVWKKGNPRTFMRKTHVSTSKNEKWFYHMLEETERID